MAVEPTVAIASSRPEFKGLSEKSVHESTYSKSKQTSPGTAIFFDSKVCSSIRKWSYDLDGE